MTDIETTLSRALHTQAEEALRTMPHGPAVAGAGGTDTVQVVHLGDYIGGATPRRTRHGLRVAAGMSVAAAAVAAMAAGVTYLASQPGPASQHTGVGAAGPLATVAATSTNPYGLAPGQYLHVHSAPTQTKDAEGHVLMQMVAMDTWIPADPSAPWVYLDSSDTPAHRTQSPCDAPSPSDGVVSGCSAKYLPTDDAGLRAKLDAADRDKGRFAGSADAIWSTGNFYLDSGYAPRAVALAVIDVLRSVPGVTVNHHVSNGAGEFGDALSYHPGSGVREVIIYDAASGRVIGTGHAASGTQALQLKPISYEVATKSG